MSDLKFYGNAKGFRNDDGKNGMVYIDLDIEQLVQLVKNPPEGAVYSFNNKDGKLIKKLKLKAVPTKADNSKYFIIANLPREGGAVSTPQQSSSTSSEGKEDFPF